MKRCVFFDRDGIVNRPPASSPYVRAWSEFELAPEFVDALRLVLNKGYEAVIVTNQKGIALGIMTRQDVEAIHQELRKRLKKEHRMEILDILYCPHDDGQCNCRKPQPGMLLEAARRHDIDLASSWMIGDSERDIEAGRLAGCRTILVRGGDGPSLSDNRVADMRELNDRIAEWL